MTAVELPETEHSLPTSGFVSVSGQQNHLDADIRPLNLLLFVYK